MRFDTSERTLHRWAADGLIGRSKIGGAVWYLASDIADVIASNATPRSVVPIQPVTSNLAAADDWQSDPLWAEAAR